MAAPKRYWVKVNVPSKILATLPKFETPVSKSRLKKLAAEGKKTQAGAGASGALASANGSKTASPQPEAGLNYKINSGLKEMSTSGLTMNSVAGNYPLDKSGKPVSKWTKGPYSFKTFSGFKVHYKGWVPKNPKVVVKAPKEKKPEPDISLDPIEEEESIKSESQPITT